MLKSVSNYIIYLYFLLRKAFLKSKNWSIINQFLFKFLKKYYFLHSNLTYISKTKAIINDIVVITRHIIPNAVTIVLNVLLDLSPCITYSFGLIEL